MNVIIRKAERKDCPRLLELVRELALFEHAPEQVTITEEEFTTSGFGENPVWWALVAETDEEIIGFALYYIRFSTWKGQRMYLEDVLVTQSARGKGVGKQLFDALFAEARQKNLKGIVWQVLEWNEPAINFYKKYKAAFDAEWINCSIELD